MEITTDIAAAASDTQDNHLPEHRNKTNAEKTNKNVGKRGVMRAYI